jgi:hypothetical protein
MDDTFERTWKKVVSYLDALLRKLHGGAEETLFRILDVPDEI